MDNPHGYVTLIYTTRPKSYRVVTATPVITADEAVAALADDGITITEDQVVDVRPQGTGYKHPHTL